MSMLHRRWLATETAIPKRPITRRKPVIHTSVLLNRAPFLTKTPSDFEATYWAYQARIRRALHNPFPYDFYFKPGSLIETRFNVEERAREVHAFGEDYVKYKEDSGIGGASIVSQEQVAAAETLASQEGIGEALMDREAEADRKNDLTSLDRKGERNLFCLLNTRSDGWRFPLGGVEKNELLHNAAARDLAAECGSHMDTWVVSRQPIGHFNLLASSADSAEHIAFVYKAHILAGQIQPQSDNITEFAWLTKEEIQPRVSQKYWEDVKDILPDY